MFEVVSSSLSIRDLAATADKNLFDRDGVFGTEPVILDHTSCSSIRIIKYLPVSVVKSIFFVEKVTPKTEVGPT